jgi:hypothetical protein
VASRTKVNHVDAQLGLVRGKARHAQPGTSLGSGNGDLFVEAEHLHDAEVSPTDPSLAPDFDCGPYAAAMAQFVIEGDQLRLRLTLSEKVWGFHNDIHVPLSGIRSVTTLESAWLQMRGWRMAGVAMPGVVALGTRRHANGYDFVAVHRQQPVVQVDLNGPPRWQRLLASVDEGIDPVDVAVEIAAAAGIARS